MISDNTHRKFLGLLLDGTGHIHLMTYGDYEMIRLPVEGYDQEAIDFKLLFNPLNITAIRSDESVIRAAAMNTEDETVARLEHVMSRAKVTTSKKIYNAIFPFTIKPTGHGGFFQGIRIRTASRISPIAMAFCVAFYLAFVRIVEGKKEKFARLGLIAVTGVYGLIVLAVIGPDR